MEAPMRTRDLTPEQLNNLMTYGACPWCGWPRASEMISHTDEDGRLVVTRRLVCTNPEPHEYGELNVG
jgi:hypothetical protein